MATSHDPQTTHLGPEPAPEFDSLCDMIRDFYSRHMAIMLVVIYAWSFALIAVAILAGFRLACVETVRAQIAWAAVLLACIQGLYLMKVIGWQFIHRNGLQRRLHRIEQRLIALDDKLSAQS